jgi:two-component system, chemotaxis family, response regulator PixG
MLQLTETDVNNSIECGGVVEAIRQHFNPSQSGVLKIGIGAAVGLIVIRRGKLVHITHSIDPVSRLDLYLKELGDRTSALGVDVRNQLRLNLDPTADLRFHLPADLEGVEYLIQNHVISVSEALALRTKLSSEALETVLLLQNSTATFVAGNFELDWLEPIDFDALLSVCIERLEAWQTLKAHFWSPHQRPYLLDKTAAEGLTGTGDGRLGKLLKGFSLRHLAILTYQDELDVARKLYPLVVEHKVELRDPQPPYSALPSLRQLSRKTSNIGSTAIDSTAQSAGELDADVEAHSGPRSAYRIVCVDNNHAVHQMLEKALNNGTFSFFPIQDAVKALVDVISIDPDLIFLEANLVGINGYEVCRLLRKHPRFKQTPILVMTGEAGLMDQAQAAIAGATEFLTKPLSSAKILDLAVRYLSNP